MTTHKIINIAVISVILLLATACKNGKHDHKEGDEHETLPENMVELRDDQVKLAGISLDSVTERNLSGTLKLNGLITAPPQNTAAVSMPLGGFVKSVSLIPGSSVRKGQVLAVIENPDFIDLQQDYLDSKSRLEYTEAEYKRQSDLYKNDVSSRKNMQQITSEYKSIKARQKALEQKLLLIGINPYRLSDEHISRSVVLTAPISGYVKSVNVSIGKAVSGTDVLFEITGTSNLLVELTLFEKDADKVKPGQDIRFSINNETEEHDARVYQITKAVDSDRSLKVYAKITSICNNVLPGMYANAMLHATGKRVTAVPSEAIVSFNDKDYIFLFEKNKKENGQPFTEYRMVEIRKGITDGGYTGVELPANISFSKVKVVIKGAYNLLSAKKNAGEMSC